MWYLGGPMALEKQILEWLVQLLAPHAHPPHSDKHYYSLDHLHVLFR